MNQEDVLPRLNVAAQDLVVLLDAAGKLKGDSARAEVLARAAGLSNWINCESRHLFEKLRDSNKS